MFLESLNLGIDSSGVFFFKSTHNPLLLFFSQHDSKPSAPIRISGLMCFHTHSYPFTALCHRLGSAVKKKKKRAQYERGCYFQQTAAPEVSGRTRFAFFFSFFFFGRTVGVRTRDFLYLCHLRCNKPFPWKAITPNTPRLYSSLRSH